MRKCFFADRIAKVQTHTLLTVTGTCVEGSGRITSQIDGKTVFDQTVRVKTEEEFNDNADRALERLERSAGAAIFKSTLPVCDVTGRVK